MASILGSSSPDISPTTSAPPNGLPVLRDSFSLNLSSSPSGGGSGSGGGGGGGGGGGAGSLSNGGSIIAGNGSDHGGSNNHERALSQGSDRDIPMSGLSTNSNGTNGSMSTPASNRKRQSVDGVEYPRRRATIAVGPPARF